MECEIDKAREERATGPSSDQAIAGASGRLSERSNDCAWDWAPKRTIERSSEQANYCASGRVSERASERASERVSE